VHEYLDKNYMTCPVPPYLQHFVWHNLIPSLKLRLESKRKTDITIHELSQTALAYLKHMNSASASNNSAIPGLPTSNHEDFFEQDSME
jgi:hypothetical protein